jgi:hypothetical protein
MKRTNGGWTGAHPRALIQAFSGWCYRPGRASGTSGDDLTGVRHILVAADGHLIPEKPGWRIGTADEPWIGFAGFSVGLLQPTFPRWGPKLGLGFQGHGDTDTQTRGRQNTAASTPALASASSVHRSDTQLEPFAAVKLVLHPGAQWLPFGRWRCRGPARTLSRFFLTT